MVSESTKQGNTVFLGRLFARQKELILKPIQTGIALKKFPYTFGRIGEENLKSLWH